MRILKPALITLVVGASALTLSSAFVQNTAFARVKSSTLSPYTAELSRHKRVDRVSRRRLAAEDDEDAGEEPLSKGIDSVSWLPSVIGADDSSADESVRQGAEILPLFPLGGLVYTPNSEHVLNIFEPRYRQMYNDILMNGTKRFVVTMSHPTEEGRFAQTGVLFELKDLKEVSEQTADQIKYICSHKVTGRVHLHRILNPDAWSSRKTYLKVEGTIMDDTGKDDEDNNDAVYGVVAAEADDTKAQNALKKSFGNLVDIQHELQEDVRFTRASVETLAVQPGAGKDGLWQTIRLWQNYADQRLMARQNELQADFQEKLQLFLKKERGLKDEELPSAIGFGDLSPALQEEVKELQKRMAVELQPLVLESTLTMQKILEATDHKARCDLLRFFVDAERKRLTTKKSLQGMFGGSVAESSIPAEERIEEEKSSSKEEESTKKPGSIFTDEPDAFQ